MGMFVSHDVSMAGDIRALTYEGKRFRGTGSLLSGVLDLTFCPAQQRAAGNLGAPADRTAQVLANQGRSAMATACEGIALGCCALIDPTDGAEIVSGVGGDNLANITFGPDTEPTVNIAPGVDTSPYAIDANGENLTVNIGDGATVIGPITSNHGYGEAALTMGDDANVTGAINLAGGVDPTSTATLTLGDDTLVPGTQAVGAGLTQIDGGNPNGSDTDLIRIGVRPGQQPAFGSAGGINNRDGTHSSPGPAFNASPALRTAAVMEVSA